MLFEQLDSHMNSGSRRYTLDMKWVVVTQVLLLFPT